MAEIDSEDINITLNRYSKQIAQSHEGLPSDPHNQAIAKGMRSVLYDLGLLDDDSNHMIVEEARKKAEKGKGRCK